MTTTRRVTSPDGTGIAVFESGDPSRPTILAVHGYPDNHAVWDGVVKILADRYHVVTCDVRGSGDSDKPKRRAAYRLERLAEDLAAVVASLATPVHLLAHDWGSTQAWPALSEGTADGCIASFTSISGPSLDHAAAWLRAARNHPRAAARQVLDSTYTMLFQFPVVPELAARNGLVAGAIKLSGAAGRSSRASGAAPARSEADLVNGLQIYRANMLRRLTVPKPAPVAIPVQILAPSGDRFVSPTMQTQAPRPFVDDLRTRTIAGGHWVAVDRPDVVARCVTEFVEYVEGGPQTRGLAMARAHGRRRGRFAGKLVLITGGGGGIGRASALQFAREGADLIIADIDDATAQWTREDVKAVGVSAASYHLDVSDGAAWEDFAKRVRDEHDVPDVVVNNAGIGMAGPLLATTTEDWERVLGVNLWGVIHGSRLFATQMVDRGEGGQIVNIASAAAFVPSRTVPAYATTKAAVLMHSQCLRAELANEGIGVTAICPGIVDSNITVTARHVGVDSATQQELRAHAKRSYQRRNYSPERLAKHIVDAAWQNTPVAALTPESKALREVARFAPRLSRLLAKVDLSQI